MNAAVSSRPAESSALPDVDAISPELALVDPELALAARSALVEPSREQTLRPLGAFGTDSPTADGSQRGRWRAARPRTSSRVLIGVAAATVAVLVFFDVRVRLDNPPASAEEAIQTDRAVDGSAPVSSGGAAREPTAGPGGTPVPAVQPQRFAWEPSAKADGYHVELFRAGRRVFAADASTPAITIPVRWKLDGRQQKLVAGEYVWYVWPRVGGRRASSAIVQARVTVGQR